ncbi:MAG: glycosyltransferase [Actinomycetota bacterium]
MRKALYVVFHRLRSSAASAAFRARLRIHALASGARVRLYIASLGTRLASGTRILVAPGARVDVVVDEEATIERACSVQLEGGAAVIGRGALLENGVHLQTRGELVIRDRAAIGLGSVLRALGDVEVSERSELAEYVTVEAEPGAPVVIGAGARLEAHASVLPGAAVAPGARIGSLELVNRTPPPDAASPATGVPDVSVVVSTRNRVGSLPRLLEALRDQTLPPGRFELVVTDDGSTDETAALLREAAATSPFAIRVLRHETALGPGAGRNSAWRAARAPLVAFTDDDCVPSRTWLADGLRGISEGADVVQGATTPVPQDLVHLRGFATTLSVVEELGFYETANMFYRRTVLEALGGFDEAFRYPAGEDTDLGWRARKAGYRTRFARDALVYHAVHPRGLGPYLRSFWRFRDVARVLRRHPEVRRGWKLHLFWDLRHAWILVGAAGAVAAWLLTPWAWFGCAPYGWLVVGFRSESTALPIRILRVPARVLADLGEMGTLIAGSIRHRALVL